MDSGNSGSMNSSSGDEEYDSRTDPSIPSFVNPSLTHFGSSDPNPPDPSQLLSPHLFDLHPNSSNSTNFLLNLDTSTVRSRSGLMRSDHHHHQQPYQLGLMSNNPQSSSLSNIQQPLVLGSQFPGSSAIQFQPSQQPNETVTTVSATAATSATAGALRSSGGGSSSQTTVVRSSKKRTRASRRAPTTVLTTDTSNFRAMVQEFTGIPAPPFSASSPFSRRLDLFGSGSSGIRSGGGGAAHLEGPLYPLVRPSAIKPQTSPFGNIPSSSSSSSPATLFSNVMVDATNIATSSVNYQPQSSSDHHHQHQGLMINKQPMRNMLNMQSQSLNMAFQVQSLNPLHPSTSSLNMAAGFGASKQAQPNLALDHHQEMNAGHGYGGTAASSQVAPDGGRNDVWRVEGAASGGDMSCKLNYAATAAAAAAPNSSEFHGEKGLEINVSSRGTEGTVDSWIFPSD